MHVLLKKVCANFHKNVVVSIKANINAKKKTNQYKDTNVLRKKNIKYCLKIVKTYTCCNFKLNIKYFVRRIRGALNFFG